MSVLIPSLKDPQSIITLQNDFPSWVKEFLVDPSTFGISKARNYLAETARYNTLIYADDDIRISPALWEKIPYPIPLHQVFMYQGGNHPITRLMILNKKTLHAIGGFDEYLRHNAEDYDIYLRLLKAGVLVNIIPQGYVLHKDHKKSNFFRSQLESVYVRVKHGKCRANFLINKNPLATIIRLLGYIYYKFLYPSPLNEDKQLEKEVS